MLYAIADDADCLQIIREFFYVRPTYGDRRTTALLTRKFAAGSQPRVNHRRIDRIMQLHGLLLQRHSGHRIVHAHDEVVRTLRLDTCWCSDGFEIPCWNGETVRVAFTLDTCDQEAITWTATTAGVIGEMIRDMKLIAVERRFGGCGTDQSVEFF